MTQPIGVADLSPGRSRLRVSGTDRVAFLHGQCTNDIKRLQPGDSCYAAFLNAKGKMRGDAFIVCLADEFLLEANAGLQASLEKFIITEDVVIEDVSATWGVWLVLDPWERHSCRDSSVQESPSHKTKLPAGAVTFTHPLGVGVLSTTPLVATIDAAALEVLRVEAGIPQYGADMDETTIPVEAGLARRAISYDKGCYIGQETIARIKTYGHVNRQLVQLSVDSGQLTVVGTKIRAGDNEVGVITSAVRSIRLGKALALGYVRREFATAGQQLTAGEQAMEVIKLCGS